jgi:carbonic anhydrase
MAGKFVTCLNCMDGRVQLPVIEYLRKKYDADYVDMITEAGMNGFLVNLEELPRDLLKKIDISLTLHRSKDIFIVGHYDCGGHQVDEHTHHIDIKTAVYKIKNVHPDCNVTGLWVNDKWQVEEVNLE